MMGKSRFGGLAVALVVLCGQTAAEADSDALLQRVRLSVARYELGSGGTLDVLSEMGSRLASGSVEGNVEREMRFLRAAVSADLLFVSAFRRDVELREKLESVWTGEADLRAQIKAELDAADGIYAPVAERIAERLTLIDEQGALSEDALATATGSWRDVTVLQRVAEAIRDDDAAAVLRRMGQDPCAGIKGGCAGLFMVFDGESRKAMAGLQAMGRSMKRLRAAGRDGDPLVVLLTPDIEAAYAQVSATELRLTPLLRPGTHVEAEGEKADRVRVDLLVVVRQQTLEYGFVPRVRLDGRGELEAVSEQSPLLPEMAEVKYPSSFRPFMRPIEDVVRALHESRGEGDTAEPAVGLSVEPGVPAHILGRVCLSLRRAGYQQAALIGRSRQGLALGVPLRVLAGAEADQLHPKPDVEVRVRLGGYSLRLGHGSLDIPRVRRESGYTFDTDTLQSKVRHRRIRSAAVSFMSNVAVENVMAAVWRIAPDRDPLNLVMP